MIRLKVEQRGMDAAFGKSKPTAVLAGFESSLWAIHVQSLARDRRALSENLGSLPADVVGAENGLAQVGSKIGEPGGPHGSPIVPAATARRYRRFTRSTKSAVEVKATMSSPVMRRSFIPRAIAPIPSATAC